MLGKLLKYDLKWQYKVLIVFYILAIILSILVRLLGLIENSLMFHVIRSILNGAMIAMLINSLINGLIRSWVRFINNIYKDESYLTHTLPVEKRTIYLSKVITAIFSSFTSIVLAIVCLFISYYSQSNMEILKTFLKVAADSYNTTIFGLIAVVSVVIFLEMLFIILIGYCGIIIGHKFNNGKMIKSTIIGIVLYLLTSSLTLGIVYIIGLFNEGVMNIINTTDIVNIDSIKNVMYAGVIIYLIYNIVYYLIGKIELEKGVNVD